MTQIHKCVLQSNDLYLNLFLSQAHNTMARTYINACSLASMQAHLQNLRNTDADIQWSKRGMNNNQARAKVGLRVP